MRMSITRAAAIALVLLPTAAAAQESPPVTRTFGAAPHAFLFDVQAAAARGASLAVLTEPEPAVHVFGDGASREWGAAGGGPAELASPVDVEWSDGAVFVLDVGHAKFVRYDADGGFVASRPLDGLRARRMWVRGGDTILAAFEPMSDGRAALRLDGEQVDTLLAFDRHGRSIRLEEAGAPSLTVKPPFTPQVEWTVLSGGGLVRFDPGTERLEWLDRDGRRVASTALPWEGLPLEDGDREWWLAETIPEEFMGQRVFEPLRPVARATVEFPERLPAVLAAQEEPAGGVWLQRSTSVAGERWALVGPDGAWHGEIVLPAGRELLAAGEAELFALARDELGVEWVEAYRKPAWAAGK